MGILVKIKIKEIDNGLLTTVEADDHIRLYEFYSKSIPDALEKTAKTIDSLYKRQGREKDK